MIEITVLALTFLVFSVGPVIGILMVAQEVIDSRRAGRELDELALGLSDWFESFRTAIDLANVYADLSNWMEEHIHQLNTGWIQVCARLLITVGAIGFGETSREALESDGTYRRQAVRDSLRLIEAIEGGRVEIIMLRTADLLGLFLGHAHAGAHSVGRDRGTIDTATELRTALQKCAELLRVEPIHAEDVIRDALYKIATQGEARTAGLPLLILKWVQIRMMSSRESKPISHMRRDLATQITRVSDAYASSDISRIAGTIYTGIQ